MQVRDIPFAAGPFDRAGHHRTDAEWQDKMIKSADAQIFLMQNGMPMVSGVSSSGPIGPGMAPPTGDCSIVWMGAQALSLSRKADRLFMGMDDRNAPVFALNMPNGFRVDASPIEGLGDFADMRMAGSLMSPYETQLAGTARSIFDWHDRHGFCANCGTATEIKDAGWKRGCDDCGAEHFPRVDPVAIMLAVKGDKCLMGRQANWPPGFWSCLAGFIEPGETAEQGAARELLEESGLKATGEAEYLFCQPWPFPSSLMIGIILEVEDDTVEINPDEIEAARWFTREEARQIMKGEHPDVMPPGHIAVAHHILKAWAERDA